MFKLKNLILIPTLFCLVNCNVSEKTYYIDEKINLLSPVGAPTLGIYDTILSSNSLTTSTPSSIPLELQNDNTKYNMIVFEASNTLKLIRNNKSKFKFLGLLTKGNFHFVGMNKTKNDVPKSFDYIVSFQKGSITDLALKYVLPSIFENDGSNIHYVNGVSQVSTILSSGTHEGNKVDWALIAEPSLHIVKNKNNNDDIKENDIFEYMSLNEAIKEKTNNKYDYIPQAGLFVKESFYNKNKEVVNEYLTKSVAKNLDNALNNPNLIVNKLNELDIKSDEFVAKFGFKMDLIQPLQGNNQNRFGIASKDNLINNKEFISEEDIFSFIDLIS